MTPPQAPTSLSNASKKHIQQIIAVTLSSTGILYAVVTLYWFARMKRVFRHQLIMLLVISGMFKSLWHFIPAASGLAFGHISDRFCQVSGFLVSVGTEASDFIILLIAIHTALSVLRPGKVMQYSGLYPFRRSAYACWAIFSILMAALAFTGGKSYVYVSQGTFCYLPVRPIWYRITLSWAPRYFILATIVVIYLVIYIYCRSVFGEFSPNISSAGTNTTEPAKLDTPGGASEVQAQAPQDRRNCAFRNEQENAKKRNELDSSTRPSDKPARPNDPFGWPLAPGSPTALTEVIHDLVPNDPNSPTNVPNQRAETDPIVEQTYRIPTLMEALNDKSLSAIAMNRSRNDPIETLYKRYKAIRRQLRYMFVYPMMYLLMWLVPFVNHCYFYTKANDPPFSLNMISLVSLLLQCIVNCLIFSVKEKPWRYVAKAEAKARGQRISDNANTIEMRPLSLEGDSFAQSPVNATRDSQTLQAQTSKPPRRERFWWDEEEH